MNSNSNHGLLDTPPRQSIDQNDAEDRTGTNFSNESILPYDLMELLNNCSVSANETLLVQRTETIQTDIEELKRSTLTIKKTLRRQKQSNIKIEEKLSKQEQSIVKMEETLSRQEQSIAEVKETLSRQEQSHEKILLVLTQLLQSTDRNNQRFIQSKTKTSEIRLGIDERPISRPNQEIPISNKSKFNQRLTTSESNGNTVEENRNQIGLTTTNELNSNGQLLYASDEIDKIRSEKNRGKIQIGQWCYEINVGTTDDAPALITRTDQENSQSQRTEISKRNRKISTSNLINYQLSRQLTTTLNTETRRLTKLCLLHPLKEQIISKTDKRSTKLKDCFGNNPVLIVCGENLPETIRIEMAMIFASTQGCYYSMYRFFEGKGKEEDLIYRSIKINNQRIQEIELNNLRVRKICNSKKKEKETFILKKYPSGEMEDTGIDGPKILNDQYNFKHIQLAIRCFENEIVYSNLLYGVLKIQSSQCKLIISTIYPRENQISFDCNNQCRMEFLIKIPEPFHCTLSSGYKWLEISLITNDNLNSVYSIDNGNGDKNNPIFIQIEHDSFSISFKIIKQTLSELLYNTNVWDRSQFEGQTCSTITYDISIDNMNAILSRNGLNKFCVQFRLLHSEIAPHRLPIKYYFNCEPGKSKEFCEDFVGTNRLQWQETVTSIGQKRTSCDSNLRLPVCKAPRLCHE